MVKHYLKRRKLLQKQFERLMKELKEKDFFPGEQRKDFVDKALDIDRRLSVFHPILILAGIGIIVHLVYRFGVKLK